MKPKTLLLLLVAIGLLATNSCMRPSKNLEFVGSALWSKAHDVRVSGDYAFGAFKNGLLILDISEKEEPRFVSQLYLGGGSGLDLNANTAFVAAGENGLAVVDVSSPGNPINTGNLDTPGEANDITVRDLRLCCRRLRGTPGSRHQYSCPTHFEGFARHTG